MAAFQRSLSDGSLFLSDETLHLIFDVLFNINFIMSSPDTHKTIIVNLLFFSGEHIL